MTRTIPSRSTAGIRSKGSHSSSTKVHVNVDTRTLADSLVSSPVVVAAISSSSLVDRPDGHTYRLCVLFISCNLLFSAASLWFLNRRVEFFTGVDFATIPGVDYETAEWNATVDALPELDTVQW